MTAIDPGTSGDHAPGSPPLRKLKGWERYKQASHFRTQEDEFDACTQGFWLFLATEVLLFAGLFCLYAIYRMKYPEAFSYGSHSLNPFYGGLNTVVLLISSFTVAMAIRCAQLNHQRWLNINLIITLICACAFFFIKITFEYIPKLSEGKAPGHFFNYGFAHDPHEPIWWSIYYMATGVHALHVLIGGALLGFVLFRSLKHQAYGPKHYTLLENAGLYWHLVDLIWIFLFPLLYLIH
jgi:cytochrome c oxidase subunit III